MKGFKKKGFLVLILSVSLFSCNNSLTRNYVDLNKGEVLIVKNNDIRYTNTTVSITSDVVITYDVKRDYTLYRFSSDLYPNSDRYPDSVLYNGYYYYWTKEITTDKMVVGQSTTTVDKVYSYLPIGEDNLGLSVKTQTTTTTNYSFDSQWVSTPNVEISTHIISYFNSLSDIQKECPDLYNQLDLEKTQKQYISGKSTKSVTVNFQDYQSSYYYIEKV